MKSKANLLWCVGFTLIFTICAIVTLVLVGLSDAHGHGMTTGDRNVVIFLSIVSIIALVNALILLKRIIVSK